MHHHLARKLVCKKPHRPRAVASAVEQGVVPVPYLKVGRVGRGCGHDLVAVDVEVERVVVEP
jgi:hypothetical protein